MAENETQDDRAVIVRWPCGCVSAIDLAPERADTEWWSNCAGYASRGADIRWITPDEFIELKKSPDFMPSDCTHEPKGWTRHA